MSAQPPNPPPQPRAPDLPPGVHLCQRGPQGAIPSALIGLTPILVLALGALAFGAWRALGAFPWMPPLIRGVFITAAVAAALVLLTRAAARAYRRSVTHPGVPYAPDPEARVNIALDAEHKAALLPLEDQHLEPERFTAFAPDFGPFQARGNPLGQQWGDKVWMGMIPFWIASIFTTGTTSAIVFAVTVVLGLLLVLCLFRRPTELIITPGRVDLVRHPLRASGKTDVLRYDLRARRVLIDMRARRVVLDPVYEKPPIDWKVAPDWYTKKAAQERTLSLALVPSAERALLAIARAAVSTAEPPPPEDGPNANAEPA